jgi:formylglycine-generating enzyme required for sulfatase activity
MVRIPAGSFFQGRDHSRPDEAPRHEVQVDAFLMDETLVTFEAFARFADETHFRTDAEERGFGMVAVEGMKDWTWDRVKGATFRAPFGPERARELSPRPDDPVSMVSWNDAVAYCRHLGKRLPTEAEWEYAMRAGRSGTRFPWGDQPQLPDGGWGLNFWQGADHGHNDRADGYLYHSPVRAFPPNAWGLYDPAGNLWQWVADYYSPTAYAEASQAGLAHNPRGPAEGIQRVARGGSWWCSEHTCSGFGLFYRGKNRPDVPFNNNGFRCAADLR